MRRALTVAAVAGTLFLPATPAAAHGADAPDATAYRTEVTAVTPPMPGLTVRAVEAGARLELRNDTGRTVEVLGYAGEPYLQVRPDGTWENVNSPATYLNETLDGDTGVPAAADPGAAPSWRRVSTGTTVRWHDRRTHWLDDAPPPQAAADPSRPHRLRDWAVPLRDQARTFEARGTLDWVPPPLTWLWWAGAALLAVAVAALGGRWTRPVAACAAAVLLAYAVLRGLDTRTVSPVPLVVVLAALLPVVRRGPFLVALGGAVLAVFGGLTDTEVFREAVVPVVGPPWTARVAVLVAVGAGAGMVATGVRQLRAGSPAAEPTPRASTGAPPDGAASRG